MEHHNHGDSNTWFLIWNWDLTLILGILLILGLYAYALGPYRVKHHPRKPVEGIRVLSYLSGILVIFIATVTPLNSLAHLTFFGHMTQHLLISLIAALLLVVGLPDWLSRAVFLNRYIAPVWKRLTIPFIAGLLFNANLWLWHSPVLLNMMMSNHQAHLLAQFLFLLTAFIFWWPLFGTQLEGMPNLNLAGKLVFILLSDMPMVLLGAGLTFSAALYTVYIRLNPRPFGLTAQMDQQIGGLVMWVPGGIYFIVLASVLFLRWMLALERKQNLETARLALLEEEEEELSTQF